MISPRHCAISGALFLFSVLSSLPSAQTTQPISRPSIGSTTTPRHTQPTTRPSPKLRCPLQCAKSFGYTELSTPKNKPYLCITALLQRAQNCRNDLMLLEKNVRKNLDDAETQCKTHCGTNEPCFSACTNVFSARTDQFEQTLTKLRPLCNAITTQILACFSTTPSAPQQKAFLACFSRCTQP